MNGRYRLARVGLTAITLSAVPLLGMAMNAGCTPIGAIASKLAPDPVQDALYVPPKVQTLVLVENYANPGAGDAIAERLGRQICEEFRLNKVAPTVPPETLFELRTSKGDAYHQMKIPAIGEALGAKQVLYVNIVGYSGDEAVGSEMVKGKIDLRIRFVDVPAGRTLWPTDSATGHVLAYASDYTRVIDSPSQMELETKICKETADRVAKLFHKHTIEDIDAHDSSKDLPSGL